MNKPDLALFKICFGWVLEALGSGKFWTGVGTVIVPGAVLVFWYCRRHQTNKITLNLPFGLGNVTYDTTKPDRILAWKLYVQLKTRKAALPFDETSDVIVDVYDSLFELFKITRDLLIEIPIHEAVKRRGVADLMLRVLNDGLRPHLTKWQASFRRWWDKVASGSENANKTPQEIQKGYPRYADLVNELKAMNVELGRYAEDLLAIARAQSKELHLVEEGPRVQPEQPQQEAR